MATLGRTLIDCLVNSAQDSRTLFERGCRLLNSFGTVIFLLALHAGYPMSRFWRWLGYGQPAKPREWHAPPGVARESAQDLSQADFERKYLRPHRPVVVTGAMDGWAALTRWTPQFLIEQFGHIRVKLQGSFFDTVQKMTLQEYMTEIWPRCGTSDISGEAALNMRYQEPSGNAAELTRCFSRMTPEHMAGYFSCAAFVKLKDQWGAPSFMPSSGYTIPCTLFWPEQPNQRWFFDWGIYCSPRGTVTRLHMDASKTHTVLCLLSGQKKCLLMPPSTTYCFESLCPSEYTSEESKHMPCLRDSPQSLKDKLPMQPIEITLNAGEVLFLPKEWLHEVHTTENSIMVTYNFLHGVPDLLHSICRHIWLGWWGDYVLRLRPCR